MYARLMLLAASLVLSVTALLAQAGATLTGVVLDPQARVVAQARIRLLSADGGVLETARTDSEGRFSIAMRDTAVRIDASADGFSAITQPITPSITLAASVTLRFSALAAQSSSLVITAKTVEPDIDLRNSEVFAKTLFSRDDQTLQQLNAGIDAGQHEGGGKSLEIRRFGFNLDHGGVNGGLKVLVDNVQQNQGTQGHGQGYLGSLKALSPELIQEVDMVNGPFSAEYGDFSGLGVVHIRQRETMPDAYTVRLQGGNFSNARGFAAYSPDVDRTDAYIAYDGSYIDGPFINAGRYRRDNVNGNYTRSLDARRKLGFRALYGRNDFYSSGQLPTDMVSSGALDRFGYLDAYTGGRVKLGTLATYYSQSFANGDTLRADAFIGRSLFDLFSNFTFYLNDPVHGDAFQQHDSRLQYGANAQYTHAHRIGRAAATYTVGANLHDNWINVGLYPDVDRVPLGVTTRAYTHVTNEAVYAQESVSLWQGRVLLGAGVRFDEFRYAVTNPLVPEHGGTQSAGRWQGKANAAYKPLARVPITLHANYGRGINSVDARGVAEHPEMPRLATTDFYQLGASAAYRRVSLSVAAFRIDHSNELVYVPDDGSFEFKGRTRAYGFENKLSVELTRHVALNAGLTKITNAYYTGGVERVYVDSAPHMVANAGLMLSAWQGWSASLRMRATNHYRLDGVDPSIVASGHTVFDFSVARQLARRVELSFALDNLFNRAYWETQNYFESRVAPTAPVVSRIHATPGYPRTAVAGLTLRFGGKQ